MRSLLLISVAGAAGAGLFADPASALDLGPVLQPVSVPPVVVTVPSTVAVGPITVATPTTVPSPTVTVSPTTGVGIGVTIPPSLGPVTLLPDGGESVQVAIGPGGVGVSAAPVSNPASTPPPAPGAAPPPVATPGAAASDPPPVPVASPVRAPSRARVGGAKPDAARATNTATEAPTADRVSGVTHRVTADGTDPAGAVHASLRHQSPAGAWDLFGTVTSSWRLWLALVLIVLVARWALGGILTDAVRRARLSSV